MKKNYDWVFGLIIGASAMSFIALFAISLWVGYLPMLPAKIIISVFAVGAIGSFVYNVLK